MRRGWSFIALLILATWGLYVFYGLGLSGVGGTLGGGAVFLLTVLVGAIGLLLFPRWEKETASVLISSIGFATLNHGAMYLRHHPVDWPLLAIVSVLALPFGIALVPLLSMNYWITKTSEREPALAEILMKFFVIQLFPVFGWLYAMAFLPAVESVQKADLPLYVIALLFGGVIAGSLLARWFLRRMTGQQIRSLLLQSAIREGSAPDASAWIAAILSLGAGTVLEIFRGEWAFWALQSVGVVAIFQLVWRIHRERFVPTGMAVVPVDTYQIPNLSMIRVGVCLWLLTSLSVIAVVLVRAFR